MTSSTVNNYKLNFNEIMKLFKIDRILRISILGNLYSTVLYGCCGEQYVYDKKWESCNSTVADDPRVSKKQGFGWKRPSHKAGQYMFLYRRKRRNADIKGLSHPEAMAIYRQQRSMFVTPNNPLKLP